MSVHLSDIQGMQCVCVRPEGRNTGGDRTKWPDTVTDDYKCLSLPCRVFEEFSFDLFLEEERPRGSVIRHSAS